MVNGKWLMVFECRSRRTVPLKSDGAQRLFTIYHSLFTFKVRLALLDVGAQSLACVFGLEELLLEFSLERERGLEGDFRAGLYAALDATDGERRRVRRGELSRVS